MVSGCWLGCGIVQVGRKLWFLIWLGVIHGKGGRRIVLFSLKNEDVSQIRQSYRISVLVVLNDCSLRVIGDEY